MFFVVLLWLGVFFKHKHTQTRTHTDRGFVLYDLETRGLVTAVADARTAEATIHSSLSLSLGEKAAQKQHEKKARHSSLLTLLSRVEGIDRERGKSAASVVIMIGNARGKFIWQWSSWER